MAGKVGMGRATIRTRHWTEPASCVRNSTRDLLEQIRDKQLCFERSGNAVSTIARADRSRLWPHTLRPFAL